VVGLSIQSNSKFNIISAYISPSKPFNPNHLANDLDLVTSTAGTLIGALQNPTKGEGL